MSGSTTSAKRRAKRPRGMVLTARDRDLLVTTYAVRQATRAQLTCLHFAELAERPGAWSSSVPALRLRLLAQRELLVARALPVAQVGGRSPLVYCLGPAGVPVVAANLGLDPGVVAHRQRQDTRLTWHGYAHRAAIAETYIAFRLACEAHGYAFSWTGDAELAALGESVQDGGETFPIRPDAFMTIGVGGRTACFCLEQQVASEPHQYRRKVRGYRLWWENGAYERRFHHQGLRVLGLTDTLARALHLRTAAESENGGELFWSSALPAIATDPFFAPVWFVAGTTQRQQLLDGDAQRLRRAVSASAQR